MKSGASDSGRETPGRKLGVRKKRVEMWRYIMTLETLFSTGKEIDGQNLLVELQYLYLQCRMCFDIKKLTMWVTSSRRLIKLANTYFCLSLCTKTVMRETFMVIVTINWSSNKKMYMLFTVTILM
jgi:hypothetical protein